MIALNRLGLLAEDRLVRIGGPPVPFRKALLAAFPEPSALLAPLEGMEVLSVEVEGIRGGTRVVRRGMSCWLTGRRAADATRPP